MSINGMSIDKAVAPPNNMRCVDRGAMWYTAAVPGGWNSNTGVSEELFTESQKIAQLMSIILASTNKLKGMEIQDTSWNSTIRHSLGRVKNREDLFESVKKLRKSKKAAFKQETNLVQHYLYQRHYEGPFIREYVRSSLLCLISSRTFKSFFDLGDVIRQLGYNHSHSHWDGGPAKAMLSFHSERLMEIRQFAVSRKQFQDGPLPSMMIRGHWSALTEVSKFQSDRCSFNVEDSCLAVRDPQQIQDRFDSKLGRRPVLTM
jgi:hypothetical protein